MVASRAIRSHDNVRTRISDWWWDVGLEEPPPCGGLEQHRIGTLVLDPSLTPKLVGTWLRMSQIQAVLNHSAPLKSYLSVMFIVESRSFFVLNDLITRCAMLLRESICCDGITKSSGKEPVVRSWRNREKESFVRPYQASAHFHWFINYM